MLSSEKLAILSAGVFFFIGLVTGAWKYVQINKSDDGHAHPYVDICHRASLLYAFASMLLAEFAAISKLNESIELIAVGMVVFYFATAIAAYFVHGLLRDTENQLRPPFVLGKFLLPASVIGAHMWLLIVFEISGFLILFYGVAVELI